MTDKQIMQGELAMRARQGDKTARLQLWESVEWLLVRLCLRCYHARKEQADRCGTTADDFRQVAWFAFLDAVKWYDPAKEWPFTAFLNYPVKNHVNALLGVRSYYRDALNYSESLNVPLFEDDPESGEQLDLVADPADPYESAETGVWREQLQKFIRDSLALLTLREQHVLSGLYLEGKTLKEMGEILGISLERVRQIRERGLRNIRKKRQRALQDFRAELLETEPYHGTGYYAFSRSGTSSV